MDAEELSDVGVKISELSERKIAAEVPSFERTPPGPDRRRMLARGNQQRAELFRHLPHLGVAAACRSM